MRLTKQKQKFTLIRPCVTLSIDGILYSNKKKDKDIKKLTIRMRENRNMAEKVCPQCGAPIEENAVTCRYCRASFVNGEESPERVQGEVIYQQPEEEEADVNANKIYAVLSYLGILVLIPLFASPNSEFARYHANQGLVLLLTNILFGVFRLITGGSILLTLAYFIISMMLFVFSILGIIAAARGEKKPLPIIGGIQILK